MFAGMRDGLERMRTQVAAMNDQMAGPGGDRLPAGEVRELVEAVGMLRRAVDGLLVTLAGRIAAGTGRREAAEVVTRATGGPPGEAQSIVSLAHDLDGLPRTRHALIQGHLSVAQARTIAETTGAVRTAGGPETSAPVEARLVECARRQGLGVLRVEATRTRAAVEDPAARARRQHAARSLCTWTDIDGMVAGRFRLPPETGAQVQAVLEERTRRIFRSRTGAARQPIEACAADALVDLLRSATAQARPGRRTRPGAARRAEPPVAGIRPVVHVVIDHAALVRGATVDGERCEIPGVGPVDVAWVRRLLGDAFLTAVIRKGRDIRTVAHLGRRVPAEVRTALVAAGRCCDVEGCARASYLELDHCEIDHAKGGPTSLWNLTWLCWEHHQRKTRGERLGPRNPHTGKRPLLPAGGSAGRDPPHRRP